MNLSDATTEELRKELLKRGYNTKPKEYRPNSRKCVCGRKHLEHLKNKGGFIVKCPKCGLTSEPAGTYYGSVDKWNRLIADMTK